MTAHPCNKVKASKGIRFKIFQFLVMEIKKSKNASLPQIRQYREYLTSNMMLQIIKFMNRRNIKFIAQSLLLNHVRQNIRKLNRLAVSSTPAVTRTQDYGLLNKQLPHIYFDPFKGQKFSLVDRQKQLMLNRMKQLQNDFFTQASGHKKVQIELLLINYIKKLHKVNASQHDFSQAIMFISQLSTSEVRSQKQYLVHTYQWVVNKMQIKSVENKNYLDDLKKALVKKLSEAYSEDSEIEKYESHLDRLQVLSKARQHSLKGENQNAKASYEAVFEDGDHDDTIKIEALEFLCRQGQVQRNEKYLMEIMFKVKEYQHIQPKQLYMKFIEKALSQINKNIENGTDRAETQ